MHWKLARLKHDRPALCSRVSLSRRVRVHDHVARAHDREQKTFSCLHYNLKPAVSHTKAAECLMKRFLHIVATALKWQIRRLKLEACFLSWSCMETRPCAGSCAGRHTAWPQSVVKADTKPTCGGEKGKLLLFSSCPRLKSDFVLLLGWEDEGMEGQASNGCKLIRFLSLHAPLPVLLLFNPGGQRCAAQRLGSQTQRGNNWYKQHLTAETLSVIPSDTFPPLLSKHFQSEAPCSVPSSVSLFY